MVFAFAGDSTITRDFDIAALILVFTRLHRAKQRTYIRPRSRWVKFSVKKYFYRVMNFKLAGCNFEHYVADRFQSKQVPSGLFQERLITDRGISKRKSLDSSSAPLLALHTVVIWA
jgi:hypothetical protein